MHTVNGLRCIWKPTQAVTRQRIVFCRQLHYDGRNRLSNFWTPSQSAKPSKDASSGDQDGHELLLKAGFLRQAHSGLFHLLPLGLRVQNKLESLIDRHMENLGASKVSLSSLSSEELWQRSGRLQGRDAEFLRLTDRKGAKYLLSPTHEEEITTIVANAVKSYKDLPLRLYQVSRKYRDEARPRQGLLRGREFLMKDLYTFDVTDQQARETYDLVRQAYRAFLDDLTLPYLVAAADSGNMGGNLSHEYHFVSDRGEDRIIGCNSCDNSVNEELYTHSVDDMMPIDDTNEVMYRYGITKDRSARITWAYPKYSTLVDGSRGPENVLHTPALKAYVPDMDPSIDEEHDTESVSEGSEKHILVTDARIIPHMGRLEGQTGRTSRATTSDGRFIQLTAPVEGEKCQQCKTGVLKINKAVEIGHTFHLGTRYSKPLCVEVLDSNNKQVTVQMGCHGIGLSRLMGALATLLADSKGLNWPSVIAPFNIMIVPGPKTSIEDANQLYDLLPALINLDVAIDDRDRSMGWKLNDSDLVGYPFIVVMGKSWVSDRKVELQCRRLNEKVEVGLAELGMKLVEFESQLRGLSKEGN